jgi:predicted amidohydrolase
VTIVFDQPLDRTCASQPETFRVAGQAATDAVVVGCHLMLGGFSLSTGETVEIELPASVRSAAGNSLEEASRRIPYLVRYKSRKVRVAAVQPLGNELAARTEDAHLAHALSLVEEAGAAGCDIVCLPEVIVEAPQTISGPYSERLAKAARRHRMYVIGTVLESDRGKVYTTAFLLDRRGALIGKYHKVYEAECVRLSGRAVGDLLPVFETDFGNIGVMICYDMMFPESARILALKGAEILFSPHGIAGVPTAEENTILRARARALDECVWIVLCGHGRMADRSYAGGPFGRSCIIDKTGLIVADAGRKPGIITTLIDLEDIRFVDGYGAEVTSDARERIEAELRADMCECLPDLIRQRQAGRRSCGAGAARIAFAPDPGARVARGSFAGTGMHGARSENKP